MSIKPAARLLAYSPPGLTSVGSLRVLAEAWAGEGSPEGIEPPAAHQGRAAGSHLPH